MPDSLVFKYLRKKCVKVNGVHASGSEVLSAGDKLTFYISDEFFEEEKKKTDLSHINISFSVAYEDENILVVAKPAGLICQSDGKESYNTLVNHVIAYLIRKGEYNPDDGSAFVPALCNRIDKNTAGLVIAAKNAESLKIMNEKIKLREIRKFYECTVFGVPNPPSDVLTAYLKKTGDGEGEDNFVKITDDSEYALKNGYKTIKTGYTTEWSDGEISRLSVELFTGRTHQIRAHLAHIGYPLLGDTKYGSLRRNKEYFADKPIKMHYQDLTSKKLIFDFKTESGILSYLNGREINLPADFMKKGE